jgi:alkylhydroperoxidase family enzyme
MPETLLKRIPRAEMSEAFTPAWDALNRLTGDATFVEVFAQAPDMLDFVMNRFYGPIFFGGQVDQRYKQLVRLRLSTRHGCLTCNKQNVPATRNAGFTDEQIASLQDYEDGPFTEAEKAVLAYADEVALTNPEGRLSPALYARLRAHFSDADLCELGTVMAVISGFAKLSFVLDLVEREDYCPFTPAATGTDG